MNILQKLADEIGADGTAPDAGSAAEIARAIVSLEPAVHP